MVTIADPGVLLALGIDPDADGATEIWAVLAQHARAVRRAGQRPGPSLSRGEWAVIAESLRHLRGRRGFLESPRPLATQVADEVEMAHQACCLRDDWLGGPGAGDDGVSRLVRRLRAMGAAEGEAIVSAVGHFSRSTPGVSPGEGDWYRVESRLGAGSRGGPGRPLGPRPDDIRRSSGPVAGVGVEAFRSRPVRTLTAPSPAGPRPSWLRTVGVHAPIGLRPRRHPGRLESVGPRPPIPGTSPRRSNGPPISSVTGDANGRTPRRSGRRRGSA